MPGQNYFTYTELEKAPDRHKRVALLHIQEMTDNEIAKVIGKTPMTVKSIRLHPPIAEYIDELKARVVARRFELLHKLRAVQENTLNILLDRVTGEKCTVDTKDLIKLLEAVCDRDPSGEFVKQSKKKEEKTVRHVYAGEEIDRIKDMGRSLGLPKAPRQIEAEVIDVPNEGTEEVLDWNDVLNVAAFNVDGDAIPEQQQEQAPECSSMPLSPVS